MIRSGSPRLLGAVLLPLLLAAGLSAACSSGKEAEEPTYTREKLMDPETCKECHSEHYTEWSGSMHAYASTDPIFRAMNDRGQKETGGQLGNFCVSCHAPLAVRENATVDGSNLDSVPRSLQGVTCYFCHQVTDVQGAHNNPLVLANDTTMRGGLSDAVPYGAHHSAYSALHDSERLESAKLCGACHDIVVPAHFSGAAQDVALERTFAEWTASYLDDPSNVAQSQACGRCHFAKDANVPIAAPPNSTAAMPLRRFRHVHEFPAVDTALIADFPETSNQLQAVEAFLDISLRVQVCVDRLTSAISVLLENNSAGHNFPSGASQDRRVWVELHAYDTSNPPIEVCTSGLVPDGGLVTNTLATPSPPNGTLGTWLLRDVTTKADGTTHAFMFWDVANVDTSQTIPVFLRSQPDSTNLLAHPYSIIDCTGRIYPLSRVSTTVWVEPVGGDVFDDMNRAGYPLTDVRTNLHRLAVLPFRLKKTSNPNATIEWTTATATSAGDSTCVETTGGTQTP